MSASTTQVLVLRVRRNWRAMQENTDRRRYRRFDAAAVSAGLCMVRNGEAGLELDHCSLLNVSFGGMCFRTRVPLQKSGQYRFLMDIKDPFHEVVLVKARICWIVSSDGAECLAGAEFTESSKGWLGPED